MKGEIWKLRVPLLTKVEEATKDRLGLTALWQALEPKKDPPCPST
jgi:hypothetical protein